jgi:hypothetical protein
MRHLLTIFKIAAATGEFDAVPLKIAVAADAGFLARSGVGAAGRQVGGTIVDWFLKRNKESI